MRRGTRLVFGAMTGTSADGVDVAAVRVRGKGVRVRGELLSLHSSPLGSLAERIRRAQQQTPMTTGEFAALARDIAIAHLAPMREAAARHGQPDLIVAHGQTLFHAPPLSLQLIDPFLIAQEFGCSVLCGLRGADLAAGGEGAPITPLADWMLFRSRSSTRAVVNLGGFINATLIPPRQRDDSTWISGVRGFDVCLCNQLLDHLARTRAHCAFDKGGALALRGRADATKARAAADRLDAQRTQGRSLGTADELARTMGDALATLAPEDAIATAIEAIARALTHALDAAWPRTSRTRGAKLLLAGGGAHNLALVAAITRTTGLATTTTAEFGVDIGAREALAMALLGAAASDGADITLPAVTRRGDLHCAHGTSVRQRAIFTRTSHSDPSLPTTLCETRSLTNPE